MRILLSFLLLFSLSAYAKEEGSAKLQKKPEVIPKVKELMRSYGFSEDIVKSIPNDMLSGSSVHFHKNDLKAMSDFAENLCKAFKGAEITFYLGLDDKGELAVAMAPMNAGIEIKMDC